MQTIKNNFLNLIVLVLVAILLLQRCKETPSVPQVSIVRDTVWVHHDSTVFSKPQVIKTIPVEYTDSLIKYLPDTNYSKLVLQYQDVVNQLLNKNIQLDSLKIDSIGYVKVVDTVTKNQISGRSFTYNLKYPIIKETITLPAKKINQLYIGGQLSGNKQLDGVGAGLLLKNKRDQIYGLSVGLNKDGQISYGVQSFWKIKLK